MKGPSILIAALSGRALAASAGRAGYRPLVVDAFGDVDTRMEAAAIEVIPNAYARGFDEDLLVDALERLSAQVPDRPAGLVPGAGFECHPHLIESLERKSTLLGCPGSAVRASKDPERFFPLLRELGILHPETSCQAPDAPEGWISKRIGACGGRHIRRLERLPRRSSNRYYQREIEGQLVSATAIASAKGTAFAFTQPWCNPYPGQPYRYGGMVAVDRLDPDLEARLIDSCLALVKPLGLVGIVSFDFIVNGGGEAYLIDVNPRPGASLEILEDAQGSLFKAHIAACRDEDAVGILARSWRPKPRASAYLYADNGPLTVPTLDWPNWVCDIPAEGQSIAAGAPVATVWAEAEHPELARKICIERLGEIERMLYRNQNEEQGVKNACCDRSRP